MKTTKMLMLMLITSFMFILPNSAMARQCIYNNSGAVLDVSWHNSKGNNDNSASNHSLSVGFQACQDNSNLGFAVIECNGCIFAELAAQTAVTVGGAGAYGLCLAASGGSCAMAGAIFEVATEAAVQAIPPAFNGAMVIVPDKGKTVKVEGNAFGLKVAH
jgi:hypothetical protein